MSSKPIFCATHPRACSTAFERVFMTRRDTIKSIHEPFGDAFYFGPERLSTRFEDDAEAREKSGFADSTFKTIFDQIDEDGSEGKRLFIKDIIHYLVPPGGQPACIAPSLGGKKKGVGTINPGHALTNGSINGLTNGNGHAHANPSKSPYPFDTVAEPSNPTVVPSHLLSRFHFTFLIRDPHSSIPSYFRCTVPPLDDLTGFHNFDPLEAGYDELRRVFEYLRATGCVGPHHANGWNSRNANHFSTNGPPLGAEICVVDADDLLDDPEGIIRAYCTSVELEFDPDMLNWEDEEHQRFAKETFAKWPGFHEDAIDSTDLKPRTHKKARKTEEQWDVEWREKYGPEAAKVIRDTVDANMDDYLYMRQFVIRPKPAED